MDVAGRNWALALVLSLALGPICGFAAEFCVTTSQELELALNVSQTNGESDVVRIAGGLYEVLDSRFNFDVRSPVNGDAAHDLLIEGGWKFSSGDPCALQLDANTVLDGRGLHGVFNVLIEGTASITVRNLTFANGLIPDSGRGGGLRVQGIEGYVGDVRVERCKFLNNEARFGSALSISRGGTVRVLNNLFAQNLTSNAYTVAVNNSENGIYFVNNTVVGNSSSSGSFSSGVNIIASPVSQSFVTNNNLWDNEGAHLVLGGDGIRHLYNNNIGPQDPLHAVADFSGFNLSVDPDFVVAPSSMYDLAFSSPLRDAGRNPPILVSIPPPFEQLWSLPGLDLFGRERKIGGRVDIGAFEYGQRSFFANGFEEKNAAR